MLDLREPDRAELVDLGRSVLRCWEWGDPGAPPVVLTHGGFDHGRMFDGLAPLLADAGLRVIAVDALGHGDSSPVDSGQTWSLQILALAQLVQHLGGGAIPFVGHSFGGGLAMGLAGSCPELVSGLVLLDSLGPPEDALRGPTDDLRPAVLKEFTRVDRDLFDPPRSYSSLEEMAARRAQANPRLGEDWAMHLTRYGARPAPTGGWMWKADPRFGAAVASDFDVDMLEEEFRRVRCPVLVLWGTEPDTWRELPEDEADARAGWLRGRLVRVPSAGHYVHVEQPEPVAAETIAFLRGL